MPNNTKSKKNIRPKPSLSQEEKDHMLMWWVYYDGNSQLVADKMTEFRGKRTSRKVVWSTAKTENFDAKAPMLKARVDQFIQEENNTGLQPVTPQEIHFTEVGLDLLSIDAVIIKQAKRFVQGDKRSNTPFKNMGEVITSLKFVSETIKGLTGKDVDEIRDEALTDVTKGLSKQITGDLVDLLDELPEDQRKRIVARYRKQVIEGSISLDN